MTAPEPIREVLERLARAPGDAGVLYEAACVHDRLGLESEAVPYYVAAIERGLTGEALRGAYLGLGSTYRALGRYAESKATFLEGLARFPGAQEIRVFLAMTLHNLGEHHEAVASLLRVIADTTADAETQGYERAIRLYAENLDRIWEAP